MPISVVASPRFGVSPSSESSLFYNLVLVISLLQMKDNFFPPPLMNFTTIFISSESHGSLSRGLSLSGIECQVRITFPPPDRVSVLPLRPSPVKPRLFRNGMDFHSFPFFKAFFSMRFTAVDQFLGHSLSFRNPLRALFSPFYGPLSHFCAGCVLDRCVFPHPRWFISASSQPPPLLFFLLGLRALSLSLDCVSIRTGNFSFTNTVSGHEPPLSLPPPSLPLRVPLVQRGPGSGTHPIDDCCSW